MTSPFSSHLSPGAGTQGLFFPSSQPTPDVYSLSARRQQMQQYQQMQQAQLVQHPHSSGSQRMNSTRATSPLVSYDERNDRFSAIGSHPSSPVSSVGGRGVEVPLNFARAASPQGQRPTSPAVLQAPPPVTECDYDTNPTELYLTVQRKDWDAAAERAAQAPAEASTWVSRKESDGKLRWRLLPLHAAIIFKAPEKAVGALLCAFAQAAACKDDQGMLPIHLAFRNGCDEGVVNLLLMAYPQSVEVQDRKGRVPLVLAQQSNHPNKEAYIKALERGPAYYAVANAAKDPTGMGATFRGVGGAQLSENEQKELEQARLKIEQLQVEHAEKVSELESELAKTQETSQVLVDHVNSLEAQLASRSDTERFLATKIANLDTQLRQANKQAEDTEAELQAANQELEETNASLLARAEKAEAEASDFRAIVDEKKEAVQKVNALTNKERHSYEDRMAKCERDAAAHQANAAVLEAQLKRKTETEHSLASQVSMLAAQLAASASNTNEATTTYSRKCEALTAENTQLKEHIAELERKLATVASALDAMAAEQERIVAAAQRHERTMAAAAAAHHRIVTDTARQESLLEDAAKEREQIVAILMRQAEDAERTTAERERVLQAVKEQEGDMMAASKERDLVVASVNKQREYMDYMLNGELKFLKENKSADEIEDEQLARDAMEKAKEEFLASASNDQGEEQGASPVGVETITDNDAVDDGDDDEDDEDDEQYDDDADEATAVSEQASTITTASRREVVLQAQIAIEEAMLRRLRGDEIDDTVNEVPEEDEEQEHGEKEEAVEDMAADPTDVEQGDAEEDEKAPDDDTTEKEADPVSDNAADTDSEAKEPDEKVREEADEEVDTQVDADDNAAADAKEEIHLHVADSTEFVGDISDYDPNSSAPEDAEFEDALDAAPSFSGEQSRESVDPPTASFDNN